MCTYSISVDDTVLERVKPALPDNKAVEAWMQSQMDILLLQLANSLSSKPKSEDGLNSMTSKTEMPDIVFSLLGAGAPVADHDISAREAYHNYLEEKYNTPRSKQKQKSSLPATARTSQHPSFQL